MNFDADEGNLGTKGIRGLAAYIREGLSAVKVDLKSVFIEYIMLRINLQGTQSLHVGLVYRNRQNIQDHLSTSNLCSFLHEVCDLHAARLVIAGDFNIKEIDWSRSISLEGPSHYSQNFLSCTQECCLHQHVRNPTRFRPGDSPSTLDLIFSSEEQIVQEVKLMAPLGHSDHSCLSFSVSVQEAYMSPSSYVVRRNLRRGDFNKLREILGGTDWDLLYSEEVEDHWRAIADKINQATEESIPLGQRKKMKNLFMNKEGKQLRKKKTKAYAEYAKAKTESAWKKYTKARNKLRKWTRASRSKYEANVVNNAKEKPKMLWKYINSRLKVRSQIEDLQREDGSFAQTSSDKAEELNRFFATIFTEEDLTQVPELEDRSDGASVSTVEFDTKDIETRLKRLNPSKSPGPDGITSQSPEGSSPTSKSSLQEIISVINGAGNSAKGLEGWPHISNI